MSKKTSEVEELFGGLYYEEGGYFHLVGNHPKFIERAENLLIKEKMELVERIEGMKKGIPGMKTLDFRALEFNNAIDKIVEALKSEEKEEVGEE